VIDQASAPTEPDRNRCGRTFAANSAFSITRRVEAAMEPSLTASIMRARLYAETLRCSPPLSNTLRFDQQRFADVFEREAQKLEALAMAEAADSSSK